MGGPPMSALVNTKVPSAFWTIYEDMFTNLSEHLRVDLSIIDYNYHRMFHCHQLWAEQRQSRFNEKPHEVRLESKEYAVALEFYLQIDGKNSIRLISYSTVCVVD